VIAIGTRLADFTTGSGRLFRNPDCRILSINVCRHDLAKHHAVPLQADALRALEALDGSLGHTAAPSGWLVDAQARVAAWHAERAAETASQAAGLPSDAEVLTAANKGAGSDGVVVCAAGGLPGELHKLWRASGPGAYHVEYGYSCMGYEIAGGLGVRLALPERPVIVLVGDGSYLMMNSEISSSIALGAKLVIVVLDNRGFGCISRLQNACGGDAYNNLLDASAPPIDFVAHARSLGALAEKADDIAALDAALVRALAAPHTAVVVIETDPARSTAAGGAWWDVPVAEVSASAQVRAAHEAYRRARDE
jgi:3D-(3,5/4)-trihydroxycyclohexane-1,2-dione acylhydrolase (decyclizing)